MLAFVKSLFLLGGLYHSINLITRDETITDHTFSLSVTWTMIYQSLIKRDISEENVMYYAQFLLAYYLLDTVLYFIMNRKEKWTYVPHHVVTILLIVFHISTVLPMAIGIQYLLYFEYSNAFLGFFILFNKKKWILLRTLVSIPFVVTYVPIRVLLIPWHSLKYRDYLREPGVVTNLCWGLIAFIDVFSVYYGLYVLWGAWKKLCSPKSSPSVLHV